MLVSCGPHHSIIGNRLPRQMLTAVFRLCGHRSIGPSGVRDQSNARTRAAMSSPAPLTDIAGVADTSRSNAATPGSAVGGNFASGQGATGILADETRAANRAPASHLLRPPRVKRPYRPRVGAFRAMFNLVGR